MDLRLPRPFHAPTLPAPGASRAIQSAAALPGTTRRSAILRTAGAGAGLAVTAAATACGPENPTPTRLKGPVTITYVSGLPKTHPSGEARLNLMDEFSKTNTQQIKVDLAPGEAQTTEDKAKTLAAAGTPPDLFYVGYFSVADFLVGGMTIDIDSELKGEKDWAKQRADIFPNMLETNLWAGKLAGVPVDTNNQAMIYNIGLLQQAGVAPPKQGWTWTDFLTMAQRFVRPDTVALSMAWAGTWRHWLGTMGSYIITKDSKKITADTPEMLEVMELYQDMLRRGLLQKVTGNDGKPNALFETYQQAKNDTVFEVQGPYRMPTFAQRNVPPYMTIHIPVHPTKKKIMAGNGGWSMMVFKDIPIERRHAAALAAQWNNAPVPQAQFCIRSINIPVSKAVLDNKEFQDYSNKNPAFKGFADLAPYGWRWPALPSYAKINAAVDNGVLAIMRQEVGIKAGLAQMQKEAQLLLDEDVKLMK